MGQIWDTLIIQPFSWLLLNLYQLTGSYGAALILFALIAKIVLLYFSIRGKHGTMRQQRLMPKIKEIEKQTKGNKQKYQEAVSKLYQQEGVSPTGGCLWQLIPFPILIGLFTVIREPLKNLMKLSGDQILTIYNYFNPSAPISEISKAGYYVQVDLAQKIHENFDQIKALIPDATGLIDINFRFLGLNLAEIPQWPWPLSKASWLLIIPLLSGATAYLSSWLSQKFSGVQQQQGSMKVMFMLMPLMSVYFSFITPAALGIYWTTQNLLGIVQEYFLTKYVRGVLDKEDAAKEAAAARRKAAEEKFKEEARLKRLAEMEEKKKSGKYKKTYRVTNDPSKRSNQQKKRLPEKKEQAGSVGEEERPREESPKED